MARRTCPACGESVPPGEYVVVAPSPGERAIHLPCGHTVSLDLLDQAWHTHLAVQTALGIAPDQDQEPAP